MGQHAVVARRRPWGRTLAHACLLLLLLVLLPPPHGSFAQERSTPPSRKRVDVVLVGATSSLAKKYLFQSFFRAYLEEELRAGGPTLAYHFKGGATRAPEDGTTLLTESLASATTCKGVQGVDPAVCEATLAAFRSKWTYVQLRGEDQYNQLGRLLQQEQAAGGDVLAGRLFYLSISPTLYAGVAKSVADHVRPASSSRSSSSPVWLRVVFEKPFGRDLASAEALAQELALHLREEEIYRVDHYMGKGVVQAILPFRQANKHWLEALWSGQHVATVEVAMKETEDCEGRTSFYEGYGVIRDVLQNHLTQVLVLLKMDLPADDACAGEDVYGGHHVRTAVLQELTLLGDLDAESRATIHLGQYQGYHAHVATDRRSDPLFIKTTVPTAASVTLGSAHPRWQGAEFVLKAGKALDARTSYARVRLRDPQTGAAGACHLLFNIQGGALGTAIAWNREACAGLIDSSRVRTPPGWVAVDEKGDTQGELHVLRPVDGESSLPNAYDVVVAEVLEGDRSMFLGTEELLSQWRVWDRVLAQADAMEPALYPPGFDLDEVHVHGFVGGDDDAGVRVEL